ncbi:ABC transporter ATP-binding protein [uncultured Actinomyces sp.]|uniref:ABC transporter ATP-binding protein/permease n=1 Tax=uncultured Actinomyces sp. TaxID=249061 RepID=UPI0028E52E39|nr:ABC transporter ATP-binding protein [uncultured Actinomyces sp.]
MKRVIVVACSWAAALCLALAYLVIGWGIDDIAGNNAWSTWWIALVGALGSGFFAWAVSALGATAMKQLEPRLRHSMIRQVFALGPTQRTSGRAGRVVNSATDGVERVAAYKGIFLAPMIASLTTPILVVIVVALTLDPASGGFLAIAIPLVPICVLGFRKAFKPVSSRYRHASRQLAAKELDAIQGLGDLALMNAGKDMGKRLADAAEEVRSKVMSYLAGNQLILLVIDSVFSLGMITGAITLALICYEQGALSVGGAISLVLLSSIMLDPLDRIGQFFYIGMGGIAANKEIKKFNAQVPAVMDVEGVKAPAKPAKPGEIRLEDVSFAYTQGTPVLQGASLTISPGEHVALAGSSGAGKSTISALLQGYLRPRSGHVSLNGVDLADASLSWVRAQSAVVEQSTYLFSGTLRENLLLAAPTATDAQLVEALRAAHLGDFYEALPGGLDARVGARGLAVSGGEAQRIAIARAFLKNASIMILDEPTAHVDLASEREILASLDTVCAGRTTLTISHRDATIKGADRVATLQEGMIR